MVKDIKEETAFALFAIFRVHTINWSENCQPINYKDGGHGTHYITTTVTFQIFRLRLNYGPISCIVHWAGIIIREINVTMDKHAP